MARFTLPRDLYHGENALEALKTLEGKRAIVVVGGGSMKRFGFLDKVCDYLKEAGMEVALFEGVEPDPSVDTVMKGAAMMREFEPDWSYPSAAVLQSMLQKQCGHSMNIQTPPLNSSASHSTSQNFAKKLDSALSHLLPVPLPK